MVIGCVKEIKKYESRVGLTPSSVKEYTLAGNTVLIETKAGEMSGFTDADYVASGAKIVLEAKDVWNQVDMMVKVKEPLEPEYGFFRSGLILYTYLHLAADEVLTKALLKAKVKGVADAFGIECYHL